MDLLSCEPFWRLKNGLLAHPPTLHSDISCDVVIIGGGVSGALAAHALIKEGLKVIVIEKYDIAAGSTSGSTALLQYELDESLLDLSNRHGEDLAKRAYEISYQSINDIEAICNEIGYCYFQRKKSFYLASSEEDAEKLLIETRARQRLGFEVDFLPQKTLSRLFSFQRPGALLSNQAAQMDPYIFTHHLLHWGHQRGLEVYDRTSFLEFKDNQSHIIVRVSGGHFITTKHLIFATGYESTRFLPSSLYTIKSTFALVSKPLFVFPGWFDESLIWETARPYIYLRTTLDGRALIGGLDEDFYDPKKRDAMVNEKAKKLAHIFVEMFPQIRFEPAYAWGGTFVESIDGLPYIGSSYKHPNVHFSCGFGGNGITYSTIAAKILCDKIIGRNNPDASIFSLERN